MVWSVWARMRARTNVPLAHSGPYAVWCGRTHNSNWCSLQMKWNAKTQQPFSENSVKANWATPEKLKASRSHIVFVFRPFFSRALNSIWFNSFNSFNASNVDIEIYSIKTPNACFVRDGLWTSLSRCVCVCLCVRLSLELRKVCVNMSDHFIRLGFVVFFFLFVVTLSTKIHKGFTERRKKNNNDWLVDKQ